MSKRVVAAQAVTWLVLLGAASAWAAVPNDVNGDAVISVSDIQCVLLKAFAPGSSPACLAGASAADINCDGTTNVVDLQLATLIVLKHPAPGVPAVKDANENNVVDACETFKYGITGTLSTTGFVDNWDNIFVFGLTYPVEECNIFSPWGSEVKCFWELVSPQPFPLTYECLANGAGDVYPVAVRFAGTQLSDVCGIYSPAPVTIVQGQWSTGIDLVLQFPPAGTVTGTITCATCNLSDDDSLSVIATQNTPPFSIANKPLMKKQLKVKPIGAFPKVFEIPGVPVGNWYVSAGFDNWDDNPQGPPGSGDKTATCYKGADGTGACEKVNFVDGQTVSNVDITL